MFDKKKDLGTAVEYSDEDVLHLIAGELIDCIHAKDSQGLVEALRALISCIEQRDEEMDSNQA